MSNKIYDVVPMNTSLFGGSLDPKKLTNVLNKKAQEGWVFEKSIQETKKTMGIFKREAHFLILSKSQ